ncbi:hypothetical protein V8C35DRAFT_298638 [Trichoderma chlorosporum]
MKLIYHFLISFIFLLLELIFHFLIGFIFLLLELIFHFLIDFTFLLMRLIFEFLIGFIFLYFLGGFIFNSFSCPFFIFLLCRPECIEYFGANIFQHCINGAFTDW